MSQTDAEKRAGERRKRLLKYFNEAPDPRERLVALTFLVAAAAVAVGAGAVFLLDEPRLVVGSGSVVAAVCATAGLDKLLRYRRQFARSHPRPSDREMDLLLARELDRIQLAALEKLGITSDDLELTGLEWDPVAQLEESAVLRDVGARRPLLVIGRTDEAYDEIGADGVWRFSEYHTMVICPTHFSLGIYLCTIDILSGSIRREGTREYHYDDVVAVLTTTIGEEKSPHLLRDGKFHFARTIHRQLQIVASSGDDATISVAVPGRGESKRAAVECSQIEDVIAAVRRVLRDHKSVGRFESV